MSPLGSTLLVRASTSLRLVCQMTFPATRRNVEGVQGTASPYELHAAGPSLHVYAPDVADDLPSSFRLGRPFANCFVVLRGGFGV